SIRPQLLVDVAASGDIPARWSKARFFIRSGPETVLDRVAHPDVRLPVRALVVFSVDPDRRQATREPVVATFRKRHRRPALPLGDGARDPQRPGFGFQDVGPETLMNTHPRVEQQAVWPAPLRVPLDLDQWVALLP